MPSASSDRDSRLYVEDMLEFCGRVVEYTTGLDQAAWRADRMRYDATLRNLELIGEAANRVAPESRAQAERVPWRQLVATRNRLIHAYLGLDDDVIWNIVSVDVPALQPLLREMLTL